MNEIAQWTVIALMGCAIVAWLYVCIRFDR